MNKYAGKFIVIEGLEGAGKSTAIAFIQDLLTSQGYLVHTLREPGGTHLGELIRGFIKAHDLEESLDPRAELLLFYAARVQLLERVIKPLLNQGYYVLCDRFELSTLAYQGGGRGLSTEMIKTLSQFCLDGFKPDLTLFLEIDLKVAFERVRARGDLDRMESESKAFFEATHQGYLEGLTLFSNVIKIDARASLNEVQNAIKEALYSRLDQSPTS